MFYSFIKMYEIMFTGRDDDVVAFRLRHLPSLTVTDSEVVVITDGTTPEHSQKLLTHGLEILSCPSLMLLTVH